MKVTHYYRKDAMREIDMRVALPIWSAICFSVTMPVAFAQDTGRYAHASIQQGDYAGAERTLIA
jgi:hypothetical protein